LTERIVEVDAVSDPRWEQLVSSRRSDVFHSPQWLRVLAETYGFDVRARLVLHGDVATAGLVFVDVGDHMDQRLVSLPFSDFCDPMVDTIDDWSSLTRDMLSPDRRFHLKVLHNEVALSDDRLEEAGRLMWHAVNTDRDEDDVWASIESGARRAIRKAESAGIVVRTAESVEDVRAFYELHLRVRKYKYRLLAQPFLFFERIWTHLLEPGHGALLLATVAGEVVGGVMYLEWGNTLDYKFNASDPDGLAVRPNDLVVWKGIEHARSRSLEWLAFGVSDMEQEGLVRYKRKYASIEKQVVSLRRLPDGSPSDRERAARTMLGRITDVLVADDVPDTVSERAGDVLYRYFT
jgi:CelD/BcsL family acetyltransferase involved in cellulose biosynthesis